MANPKRRALCRGGGQPAENKLGPLGARESDKLAKKLLEKPEGRRIGPGSP